jgi:hypothetical protein
MCIDRMNVIPQVKALSGDIVYVFEKGGPKWEKADKQMNKIDGHPQLRAKYRYKDHIFLTKLEAAPLQTADSLANLKWKAIRDTVALHGESHPLLKILENNPAQRPIWYDEFHEQKLATVIGDSIAYNEEYERERNQASLPGPA